MVTADALQDFEGAEDVDHVEGAEEDDAVGLKLVGGCYLDMLAEYL